MFNKFLENCFSSSDNSNDKNLEIEYKEFLPEVHDTWTLINELSNDTEHFDHFNNLYKYERSEYQQKLYFDQLKTLDNKIYNLSLTIHQRIQFLEKLVQPILNSYSQDKTCQQQQEYTPAYIRIAQYQLHSLKLSFKQIILKYNLISIDYQNNLCQINDDSNLIRNTFQQISRTTIDKLQDVCHKNDDYIDFVSKPSQEQVQLQILEDKQQSNLVEKEREIIDLETRLESIKILKDRIRQMNEMTMALFYSVEDQNEIIDNIWLNTTTASDHVSQSIDEFRLVKKLKQTKINLWIKLICVLFCFLLILVFILSIVFGFNQR